jgi:hypothetical protein
MRGTRLKYLNYLMLMFFLILNTGCNTNQTNISVCDPRIPSSLEFINTPSFSSLIYHKQTRYQESIQKGYDLWTDSKFEFNSALQFGFIPIERHQITKFCVNQVELRVSLPLTAKQKIMLTEFNNTISSRAGVSMQKKLADLLAAKTPFQLITKNNHLMIKAGIAHHQYRGDFFVVSLETE